LEYPEFVFGAELEGFDGEVDGLGVCAFLPCVWAWEWFFEDFDGFVYGHGTSFGFSFPLIVLGGEDGVKGVVDIM